MKTLWAALLMAPVLLGPVACSLDGDGNEAYTMADPYRKGIRSIAVPIWRRGKQEYRRDIEISLTEALVKRIEAETPYKVQPRSTADTELTGTLREVDPAVLSFDSRTGMSRETQLRLVVDFTWTDLRTGEVILTKKGFTAVDEYIPPTPLSETFFQGKEGAINKAAQRIVERLLEDW